MKTGIIIGALGMLAYQFLLLGIAMIVGEIRERREERKESETTQPEEWDESLKNLIQEERKNEA